jgi:hypothetical protein
MADRILAFDLLDDGYLFVQSNVRYLSSPTLHAPVDLAPAVREVSARNFASNTTLGAGADIYVLNRGSNSVVRMTQGGSVVAVREVELAEQPGMNLTGFRLNGIAVSEDAQTIWMTATAPARQGVVLRMPAFGAGAVTTALLNQATGDLPPDQGKDLLTHTVTTEERVGPLFNGQSCSECHNTPGAGGMGSAAQSFVTRVGRIHNDSFDPLAGHGGPIARQRSVANLNPGIACGIPVGVPPQANVTSLRSAMTLRGTGLIDNILTSQLLAAADDPTIPTAQRGRVNLLPDGRVGRFGWKAQTATLVESSARRSGTRLA